MRMPRRSVGRWIAVADASGELRRGGFDPVLDAERLLEELDRVAVAQLADWHLVREQAGLPGRLLGRPRLQPLDADEVLAKLGVVGVVADLLRLGERRLEDRHSSAPSTSTSNSVTGRAVSLTMPTPT